MISSFFSILFSGLFFIAAVCAFIWSIRRCPTCMTRMVDDKKVRNKMVCPACGHEVFY